MGLNVIQSDTGTLVSQELYIPTMKEIELKKNHDYKKVDELNEEGKAKLKWLSGQMMWVKSPTRPDLKFDTCIMNNAGKHPTVKTIYEVNKAVKKLKSKRVNDVGKKSNTPRIKVRNMYHEQCWKTPNSEDNS